MAVVAHQPHRDDARVAGRRLGHDLPGAVVRAVVDQHDLAGPADAIQHRADAAQELGQDVLLVVARGHHGQRRAVGRHHEWSRRPCLWLRPKHYGLNVETPHLYAEQV